MSMDDRSRAWTARDRGAVPTARRWRLRSTGMPSSSRLRRALVDALTDTGQLRAPVLRRAFLAVPRELFVPEIAASRGLSAVYADEALVTKEHDGQPTSSSSQPAIMAAMLEALAVRPGHRVLEVGLGTGYNAALLARLVGEGGRVTSVDIDEVLVAKADKALRRCGVSVRTVVGDGRAGVPEHAPYDRIVVTASTDVVPYAWWEQLAPGGVLVLPLRLDAVQVVLTLVRTDQGFRATAAIPGGFMPLRDDVDAPAGGISSVTVSVAIDGASSRRYVAYGSGLDRLSTRSLAAFTGLLLDRPQTTKVDRVPAIPVHWHLALVTDPRLLLAVFGPHPGPRIGLVDPRTGAFAALVADGADPYWPLTAAERYGDATPQRTALLEGVRSWREAGAPGLDRLAVEVHYPRSAAPKVRNRRTWRRPDHRIHVGWA